MTVNECFFRVLKSELWGSDFEEDMLSHGDFQAVMKTAYRQTVSGLICNGLMEHNVRLCKMDAIETFSKAREIASMNRKINGELVALTELLNGKGIKFVVVKGQTVGAYYRHPNMRVPGDIDFYCDAENFDAAKAAIVSEWNVVFEEADGESEQHIAFRHNGVDFEMHFCLMKFASQSNQDYFNDLISQAAVEYVRIEGTDVPVLAAEVNIVYIFLHLWHHLVELGAGLRQFCDLAIIINSLSPDRVKLVDMLTQLDFLSAFRTVEVILVDYLGLSVNSLPVFIGKADRRYAKWILKIVLKRGNFGKYGRKTKVRSGLLYYIEALGIKLSHYVRLFILAPKENRAVLFKEIPHKIMRTILR